MSLVVGLFKGILIGGLVGFGAFKLESGQWLNWITYGVIGALVGIFTGRPIWKILSDKDSTIWTVVLKAAFGYGICVGIYALVAKVWNPGEFALGSLGSAELYNWQFIFGAIVGGLYGTFVEFDDASDGKSDSREPKQLPS